MKYTEQIQTDLMKCDKLKRQRRMAVIIIETEI